MNNNYKKQSVKILGFALFALAISFQAKAQNTTTAVVNNTVTKNADVASAPVADGAVRLVDNKGTIKYLQVKNGLTAITNKATDGTGVTTTWQLGGALTDSTFIDVNGKAFVLDKIKLVTTDLASTNATDKSAHGTGTGWTVLIRDEATGETKKIKAGDLLQVQAGQNVFPLTSTEVTAVKYEYTIGVNVPNDISKISVYRNGAKLVAGTDYTYASAKVTVAPSATYGEWSLYVGDVIEIQWVK